MTTNIGSVKRVQNTYRYIYTQCLVYLHLSREILQNCETNSKWNIMPEKYEMKDKNMFTKLMRYLLDTGYLTQGS